MLSGAASGSQRSFPGGHAMLLFSELVCSSGCCGPSDPRISSRCRAEECCTVLFSAALQRSLCHGDVCVCGGVSPGSCSLCSWTLRSAWPRSGETAGTTLVPTLQQGCTAWGRWEVDAPSCLGHTLRGKLHHAIWVSSLQDSCNAENLYSHGEKLSLLGYMGRRGTTSLPTSLAPGKGQELSDRLQSLHSQPCSTCRAQGAAAEGIW